jgi:hypothetical protein
VISIEELKAQRFALLQAIYQDTGANTLATSRLYDVGEEIGFERDTTLRTASYLGDEHLLDWVAQGYVRITNHGVKEVEAAFSAPEEPTSHFLPLTITQNVLNVGSMHGSQIQQGAVDSIQSMGVADSVVSELVEALRQAAELEPEPEKRNRLRAAAETLGSFARDVAVDVIAKAISGH